MEDIMAAIRLGDYRVFDLLLIEIGEKTFKGIINEDMKDTLLHYTAYYDKEGNLTRLLLEKGLDPNQRNINGVTPLMYAVSRGNVESARLLILDKRINVNEKDNDKQTVLHYMLISKQYSLVEFFLNKRKDKINFDIEDKKGRNIFFCACDTYSPNLDILAKLLKRGCNINSKNGQKTVLMFSVEKSNKILFDYLLKNKADVDEIDEVGETAVHKAVRNSDKYYLERLISKFPDLTIRGDEHMYTPLMLSIDLNNSVYTSMLEKPRYDKDIINRYGKTAGEMLMLKKMN